MLLNAHIDLRTIRLVPTCHQVCMQVNRVKCFQGRPDILPKHRRKQADVQDIHEHHRLHKSPALVFACVELPPSSSASRLIVASLDIASGRATNSDFFLRLLALLSAAKPPV